MSGMKKMRTFRPPLARFLAPCAHSRELVPELALRLMDRRSALFLVFSLFVPFIPLSTQTSTTNAIGIATGARTFGATEAKFTDVTAALGVNFRNLASHTSKKYLI